MSNCRCKCTCNDNRPEVAKIIGDLLCTKENLKRHRRNTRIFKSKGWINFTLAMQKAEDKIDLMINTLLEEDNE